jgi:predicted transcriptional regulator
MGRDLKNVQQDLRLLESYGLVRMARERGARNGRRAKAPKALFRESR